MMLGLAADLVMFCGISLGLSWPLVMRLPLDAPEKIGATVALSWLGVFILAWTVYVAALPLGCLWVLPFASVIGLVIGRRALASALHDPDAAKLAIAQAIITLWTIAWLALVLGYSGGGWVADWWGHLQRTSFFLDRGPHEILFNGFDALTSRPPLANVVNGAFLEIRQRTFTHYQFFSTLFASLAFLPAGLLARRFGNERAITTLTVLFMVNPMFIQNATYTWTKLPTVFFTLTALYFFLRAHDEQPSATHALLFAVNLAAGLLTHYSTGPYAIILGGAWFWLGWRCFNRKTWWRTTAFAALAGALILAAWFGWCFAIYGFKESLLTTSSYTDKAPTLAAQLHDVILNTRDTFIPHFLRSVDFTLVEQRSSTGWWRDWFFHLYQVNFFFAFGSIAWLAILTGLLRQIRTASINRRIFWITFIAGNTILGIAVVGGRYTWGLAHVCLQPLVLLGLAFLAAQWPQLPRPWRLALVAGATVDLILGIVLQFGVEAYVVERWQTHQRPILEIAADYSQPFQMNFYAKMKNHWVFVGDIFIEHGYLIVGLLGALFLTALWLASKTPGEGKSMVGKA